MIEGQLKLIIGGLLHDIGKVLYRADDHRNHSESGFDFLKNEIGIDDQDILNQVRYHHAFLLKNASLDENSLAYITYMADNIASAADRREVEDGESGFEKNMALDSIFNILNGNNQHFRYFPKTLDRQEGINFPTQTNVSFDESFYFKIRCNMKDILANLEYRDSYINSLLEVMEANLTFVPSSTSKKEIADVSLFDHVKLTAAIGSCIYEYLMDRHLVNWRDVLFIHGKEFYTEKAFLLFSMDMSGIQAFIYDQYGNKNVLKNLRSRSFYLEIMMENAIDELLDRIGLSRANLIYSGGGHAYILLPNTQNTIDILRQYEKWINRWLQEQFKADLFLACGYTACSSADLKNEPSGSYRQLFRRVSNILSQKKMKRYSAEEIIALNQNQPDEQERECRVCHRSDHLVDDDLCEICSGLIDLSKGVLEKEFFTILCEKKDGKGIPIAPNRYLIADDEKTLRRRIANQPEYIRSYGKNRMYTGDSLSTKLWVGDYSAASTLGELVENGSGIERLGVLRADIDNLGQAFVAGFPDKFQSLSRATTFSRKLSLFFKLHINDILRNGVFSLGDEDSTRNATIIYSGGDDIFIVGAWKDILEFAVDMYHAFKIFTQNTLTISAGFGIFQAKYPISYIAAQTGNLEERSKHVSGKNAITLFDEDNAYHWDTFIDQVLGEKFKVIYNYFHNESSRKSNGDLDSHSQERGKSFLYHLLDLFRNRGEKINLARLAYTLSRLEPDRRADENVKELYHRFAQDMYRWMLNDEDSRQAITAIYLYAYLIRNREES